MDAYPKSVYKFKPNIAKRIFANITDDERLIDEILNDKSQELLHEKSERIVSIYLFLDDIRNKLNKVKGKIMSYDDADYILNIMILVMMDVLQVRGILLWNVSESSTMIVKYYLK